MPSLALNTQKIELNLYNTETRSKQILPHSTDAIKIYACGPTVYNYIHIGNFKTFIVEDLLRRVLLFFGYKVYFVMNITDIGHLSDDGDYGEDKMVKTARERKMSVWEIAEYYTRVFLEDSALLNIERPDVLCKASEHIDAMIEMIQELERKGIAYSSGGNVYFDVSKFPDYGKMAQLAMDKEQQRVESDSKKRNPRDFVLWFTQSKFENHAMTWDSPWGRGYPGWHIECSAMSNAYLGDSFDIHCGGTDHIPVHHTNEIAQSVSYSGKSPWVRFWFHSAFLLLNESKMSRSSGSFLTLKSLRESGFHALDFRYLVLSAQYSTQLKFSEAALKSAQSARLKLGEFMQSISAQTESPHESTLSTSGQNILDSFRHALADDLNTPRALAELWKLIKSKSVSSSEKYSILKHMNAVLGLNTAEAKLAHEDSIDPNIQELIDRRNAARREKNFALADSIRNELASQGISLIDSADGTKWKKNL